MKPINLKFHKPRTWLSSFNEMKELFNSTNNKPGVYIWGFLNNHSCSDDDSKANYIWYYSGLTNNLFNRIWQHRFLYFHEPTHAIIKRPNAGFKICDYYKAIEFYINKQGHNDFERDRADYININIQEDWLLYRGRNDWFENKQLITDSPYNFFSVVSRLNGSNSTDAKKVLASIDEFWCDLERRFVFSYVAINPNDIRSSNKEVSKLVENYKSQSCSTSLTKQCRQIQNTLLGIGEYDFKKQMEGEGIHTMGSKVGNGVRGIVGAQGYKPVFQFSIDNLL
jgi:hypothetical protein